MLLVKRGLVLHPMHPRRLLPALVGWGRGAGIASRNHCIGGLTTLVAHTASR